ncbi:unnamed protein product [Closterium sp. Naga37s-1]|nr:unnamed protein product [Closterium sp. Naga37s-1]
MKSLDIYSGVFTHVIDLAVEVSCTTIDQLLRGIGAGCPKLERLKLVSLRGDPRFQINPAPWRKLARQCPRITSLELDSPLYRSYNEFNETPPPPVDAFPALRSLTLLYEPSHYRFISRCSSLTSLTLWRPDAFALFSLASSSSPLRLSLSSLTIHSAWLEAALTPLAAFPRLASLAFHSCSIDPCELHALSRSLHTLTHLDIHDCPLVSSHSLAALAETNPALSSLSLHSTSYPLFAAQGLRNVLRSVSSRLHTLTLSGLPSFRPGLLARCSGLKRLTVRGRGEARESVSPSESPQKPSLEGLVAMLVRVEQRAGGGGMEGGDGVVERGDGEMVVGHEGGGGSAASASAAAAAAAEETPEEATAAGAAAETTAEEGTAVAADKGTRGNRNRRYYLDIRAEAAAARADTVAAIDESRALLTTARQKLRKAASEALQTRRMHGEAALANIRQAVILVRAAMSLCRCLRVAVAHVDGRAAREKALAKVGSAAESAGFFTAAVDCEREEGEREREGQGGGGGGEVEGLVNFTPESDLPADLAEVSETLLGEQTGMWPAFVAVSRAEARALLHAQTEQLVEHMEAITAAADGAAADGAAADGAAADGAAADGAAADGAAADGAAAQELTSAEGESGGQWFASTCDPSWMPSPLLSASPLMCPFSHTSSPHASLPSSSSSPNPVPSVSSEPQSFKALARAAVCGRLKSLALVNCTGLGERQLVRLLSACGILEELRVEGSDGFSDTVIARSQLEVLTRLTVVGSGGVTADGIGGLLGNVPRLRYLKVEASKVSERARRELLRAGVVVRGV